MYDDWTILLIKDTNAGLGFDGGRIFRKFACGILDNSDIGITELTRDMCLLKDDWEPENVYESAPEDVAGAGSDELQDGPDLLGGD